MLDRSYLVLFLALFISPSFAGQANWNCRQDPKTKAWDCVGSSKPANASETVIPKEGGGQASENIEDKAPVKSPEEQKATNARVIQSQPQPKSLPSPAGNAADEDLTGKALAKPEFPEDGSETAKVTPPVSEAPPKVLSASEKPVPAGNKPASGQEIKQSGWRCDNKGDEGQWNCQLAGADPKGESHAVEAEGQSFSLLDSGFDNKEERVFGILRDRFKTNPWGNCTIQLGTQQYYIPDKKAREAADVDMDSNYAEVYDNEVGTYEGNVEMKRADQRASSHAANYDTVSGNLDLHGDVFYSEDEVALHTDSATLKLDSDQARLRDALFISPATPIRGRAGAFYRDSPTLSRFKDASYTSCQPGNQDWIVHASDLKLNKQSGYGSAKNAWLEFKGVPVFYSPYLSFPTDDRRLTGFLAPEFGSTQKGGFSFGAPFYWNIAPNYDATLRPRYFLDRGIMLGGNFRYLTEKTKGDVSLEYMPDDTLVNQARYQASINNNTRFSQNISANLDLNIVSDKEYFRDLGNALSFPNFSFIRSTADASYIDEGISLKGQLVNYQTIDPNIRGRIRPYRQLPRIDLALDHVFDTLPVPLETALDSEYVYFQHDDGNLPDGHRFNIKPSISMPLKTGAAFITPKFSLQHTQYEINTPRFQDGTNTARLDVSDSIGRTLPILSIDSGAFIEKEMNLLDASYLHTIEPRLFYLFIPKENQKDIPIFDTSLYDFWYDSLFRENRYNSIDRIQEANQLSAAITSRLVDSKTGLERLKLNIGQIFYFRDREVVGPMVRIGQTFIDNPVDRSFFSPLVAELSSELNKHISFDTGLQWDFNRNESVRGKAFLHLENEPGEILNLGYTYRKSYVIEDALIQEQDILATFDKNDKKDQERLNRLIRSNDIIQSDISFRWPIYDNWFAIGRWQYSLLFNQTQDALLGLEKENCCWRFRIIGRRFVNNIRAASNAVVTSTGDPFTSQTGIFFQIEFKGLTGISNVDIDEFLTRSIFGYKSTDSP